MKSKTITVENFDIVLIENEKSDYISLTDMARYKDADRTNYIIQNWMRTRNAIEFNGLWEQLDNLDFKLSNYTPLPKRIFILRIIRVYYDYSETNKRGT